MTRVVALYLAVLFYWAQVVPADLSTLDFDKLNTDASDYSIEEEDLDDYGKLLYPEDVSDLKKKNKANIDISGVKKKQTAIKSQKGIQNSKAMKNFFNLEGADNRSSYNDDNIYALAEALAAQAVAVKGNENRKYRKGTKVRGFHNVHHKDEYKKNKVIYEDDDISGVIQKVGSKGLGFKVGAGSGFHKGHIHHDQQNRAYGKKGIQDKAIFDKQFSEFDDLKGFDVKYNT